MKIATAGNVRTTVSANQSLSSAFNIALHSGSVMGFALVSLASLGMLLIYLGLKYVMPADIPSHVLMEVIAGFGLGLDGFGLDVGRCRHRRDRDGAEDGGGAGHLHC